MALPTEFLTFDATLTFGGAMTATFVVVSGIRKVTGWSAPWLGLIISQFIVVGAVLLDGNFDAKNLFIGVINGFLVFLSALGLNEAAVNSKGFEAQSAKPQNYRTFLRSWFEH